MDFEFNQSSTLTSNGVTPVRTAGDVLIQYDLSQGGTNPVLFLSRWLTTGATSLCEASNSLPCWSDKQSLSAQGDATGSINTTAIPAGDADGQARRRDTAQRAGRRHLSVAQGRGAAGWLTWRRRRGRRYVYDGCEGSSTRGNAAPSR